jgi:hypothetical protein
MTEEYLAHWFADRVYHRVALTDPGTDNPDQRIAEDVRLFVDNTLILGLGLLRSTATLLSFVTLLWSLSQPLTLGGVTVHGYLVWVALLYAGFGTWLTHLVVPSADRAELRRAEGGGGFSLRLMRFRENAEGVAFFGGEADEKAGPVAVLRRRGRQLARHHGGHQAPHLPHHRLRTARAGVPAGGGRTSLLFRPHPTGRHLPDQQRLRPGADRPFLVRRQLLAFSPGGSRPWAAHRLQSVESPWLASGRMDRRSPAWARGS